MACEHKWVAMNPAILINKLGDAEDSKVIFCIFCEKCGEMKFEKREDRK